MSMKRFFGRLRRQRSRVMEPSEPPPYSSQRSSTSLTAAPSTAQSKPDSVPGASTPEILTLTTDQIREECPRLRVLVVGKTGAGKSSLISRAFGVTVNSISHGERGVCKINNEVVSSENPCFVLHDSMGFEPGDTENLELARKFLEDRTKPSTPFMDRLHVIWLCIQIPSAGGRVFETGDEEFIAAASASAVPVLVVFTQFDKFCGSILRRLPPNERTITVCEKRAEERFKETCVKELEPFCERDPRLGYARTSGLGEGVNAKPDRKSLDDLIQATRRLVEDYFPGDTWLVSAMAQRASIKTKIDGAVGIGMKKHWRKLASSVVFADRKLETCLNTVHFEVTASWNFYDPNELLRKPKFTGKIRELAQFVTPDSADAKKWFPTMANIQSVLEWAMGLGPPIAVVAIPAITAVGVSAVFIGLMANIYNRSPEILRCFMGYIIDLTLILEQIFLVTLSKASSPLTESDIDTAFQNYVEGGLGDVHREIREFVGHESFAKIARGDDAEEKIKNLIYKYSPSVKAEGGVGES
ncbi:hypothetical protein B0H19DRAFT_1155708 [Mycena capillaripes]|nr:hypothetical protein B0H19DRAFT_1155708 [Mycena capillaripes]